MDIHQREVERYPIDEPIFIYLRDLKERNIECYLKILFFFGEIDEMDNIDTISWIVERKYMKEIKKGFKIINPGCKFEIINYENNMVSFKVYWKENDFNPIIFNKILFPNFCIIPKKDLNF